MTLALGLGIAAGPAQAAPGKPSLYEVPPVTKPTFAPDKVAFGWSEVAFDQGSTNRRYQLTAYAGNQVVSTIVAASGNTSQDAGTVLQLSSPSGYTWTIKLTALEDLGGQIVLTTADPVYTVFDHDGPTVRTVGLANGIAWTRLPSLPLSFASDPNSDAASGQVDVDSAGFECNFGAEPECPIAVDPNFPVQFGRFVGATRDLPPGDGIKTVWVRLRDGARFTKASRTRADQRAAARQPGPGGLQDDRPGHHAARRPAGERGGDRHGGPAGHARRDAERRRELGREPQRVRLEVGRRQRRPDRRRDAGAHLPRPRGLQRPRHRP